MAAQFVRARIRRHDGEWFWRVVAFVAGIVARATSSARWYLRRGYAFERLGRVNDAQAAYEASLARPGRLPEWYERLIEVLERQEDWPAMERAYRAAIEADPTRENFHAGLARVLERQQRWAEAAEAYGPLTADPNAGPWPFLRLARVLEKQRDWPRAEAVYTEIVEREPHRTDIWMLLARVRQERGERRAAVDTYRRALESSDEQEAVTIRLRLAAIHDDAGHWGAACRWLEENVELHPDHARSHRLLAKVAEQVWDWGGYFEGSLTLPEQTTFRRLPQDVDDPATHVSGETEDARRYLRLACQSMERAVALHPERDAWWSPLGELREKAGYLPGALEAYETAVDRAESSDRRWVMKSLHRWQFRLECAHAATGNPRVEDPMFACQTRLADVQSDDAPERPLGVFAVEPAYSGLRIWGWVTASDVEKVEILLDDQVLRPMNVGGDGLFPAFALGIRRPTLDHFPGHGRIRVRVPGRGDLLARGCARAVDLTVPHGDGSIAEVIASGTRLDKKGMISPTREETRARQDDYLRLYELVRDVFDEEFGRPLFLMYGTLLGYYRDGDFIPGDDDFDAGYVSELTDPRAVKEETKRLMIRMVQAGFTISFNRRGRLFRASRDDIGGRDLHLDLRPLWFQDGRLWVHNYVSYPATVDDFLPVEEGQLRGTRVYVPRRTEAFLREHYGPGWKVPDPSFAYHPDEVDPTVMAHLDRALITPAEYRAMLEELDQEDARRPGMGRLVSIGSQPLYPVDEFIT